MIKLFKNTLSNRSPSIWKKPSRAFSTRFGIFLVSFLIAVSPFVVLKGSETVRGWVSNQAYAATNPQARVADDERHVLDLRDLLQSDPAMLKKLISHDLDLAFAEPQLKRIEGSIHVWQYSSAGCVVDVYLKSSAADDALRVFDYDVRPSGTAYLIRDEDITPVAVDSSLCLNNVFAQL